MKSISILGSTGSIGVNTLKVVEHLKNDFRVVALGAGGNVEVLAEQVNPLTGEGVSVAPLTWSHSTFVATVVNYLRRLKELE